MGSLEKSLPETPAVKWRFPDMHPEGRKYVMIAGVAVFASFIFWDVLTWPLIGLTLWVAAFSAIPCA